ncbi:MAG TPA: alpha-amylase family protein [Actinomycetota bacterium]|nr:alpha-amylase family protein [Actinomycetota bacterium]
MSSGIRLESGDLWWKNAVLYELDVETYMDSDGDGVGDFCGLIERMDHLQALGVTCLWMMPFYPTPNRDDGYDISDYYTVDPRYGTLGDFVAFIHAADERGIRVIIDLVVNHTSDQHPWFQDAISSRDSKYRDFYVWSDEPIPEAESIIFPGLQTGNWTQDRTTGQYYFHRFHDHQPDLNLANPKVREEIMQIMRFWLQLGVAGFRFDAAPFMIETVGVSGRANEPHHDWLRDFTLFVKRRRGDAVLLGEANLPPEEIAQYFGEGHELHLLFNFMQNGALMASLATGSAQPLHDYFAALPEVPELCGWVNFARLHDEINMDTLDDEMKQKVFEAFAPEEDMQIYGRGIRRRLAPIFGGDRRRLELLYSLTFSTPGMPMLYYGDEIGMGDNMTLEDRLPARTPMQWTGSDTGGFSNGEPYKMIRPAASEPFGPKQVNVRDQQHDPGSLLHWMRRLVDVRRHNAAIGYGKVELLDSGFDDVLAHRFVWETNLMVAVHNLSDRARSLNLRRLAEDGAQYLEVEFADPTAKPGDEVPDKKVTIPGYGYRWIRGFTRPTETPLA